MTENNSYYTHSGNTPTLSILLTIAFGLCAALILSAVYGYAIFYIPIIYLNFFITLGFGFLVGIAVGTGGKIGKARNTQFYGVLGFAMGLFAAYAGWVMYFYAGSEQSFFPYHLKDLWANMQFLTESGIWSIFGWTPTGWQLYVIWGIEALMIIGASTLIAIGFVDTTPFCEECNTWVENGQVIEGLENIEDRASFKSDIEQGKIERLSELKQLKSESNYGTEVHLSSCVSCSNTHFLSLECTAVTMDDDGKLEKTSDRFMQNFILSNDQYATLSSRN